MDKVNRWNIGKVTCIECGKMLNEITKRHLSLHGMTRAQYRDKFSIPKDMKLNHRNLVFHSQKDIRYPYEGYGELYEYSNDKPDGKLQVKVRFHRDHVSGKEYWAGSMGKLKTECVNKWLTTNRKFYLGFLYYLKLDNREKHLIRFERVDSLDGSHVFVDAWPEVHIKKKNDVDRFKIDPRVDKIHIKELKSKFAHELDDINVDSVEGLKDLQLLKDLRCEYDKYGRLQAAKEMIRDIDIENGVKMFRAIHEFLMLKGDGREEYYLNVYDLFNLIARERRDIVQKVGGFLGLRWY